MKKLTINKIDFTPQFDYRYGQIPKDGPSYLILDNNFKPVANPFYCKEYFQDIIWSELTMKENTTYGLRYKPTGNLLKDFYIAIEYIQSENNKGELNYENTLSLIRDLEKSLGIKEECEVYNLDKSIVLKPSSEWLKMPHKSSLLLQTFRHCKEYDKSLNVVENMIKGSINTNYKSANNVGAERLKLLIEGGKPVEKDWLEYAGSGKCHGTGMNSYSLKIEK